MIVVVVGGGWYGVETALSTKEKHPEWFVMLLEENSRILKKISGKFGNRLHNGSHYPRCNLTRIFCRLGQEEFRKKYPELINEHEYSLYGLGVKDAEGKPPKVNKEQFAAVCKENGKSQELYLEDSGYYNMQYAAYVDEPSLALGEGLRQFFEKKLQGAGVELRCNFRVRNIEKIGDNFILKNEKGECLYASYLVNATSYQALLPEKPLDLFLHIKIFYQPCFGLVYKRNEAKKPFSFIVMDGQNPSLMPCDDRLDKSQPISNYLLTHAKYSILERFATLEEAEKRFFEIDDQYINDYIKPQCEVEIKRYWPGFFEEFTYSTWMGSVLVKLETQEDFRAALTFREEERKIVHIIPAKISNVFQVAREVLSFLEVDSEKIIRKGNYSYIKDGVLDLMYNEKESIPAFKESNELKKSPRNNSSLSELLNSKITLFSSREPARNQVDPNVKRMQNI